jgi:hypothetical protein
VHTEEIVERYVGGRMGRRQFIRRMVAAGVGVSAAISYAELLRPARAYADHGGLIEHYNPCVVFYPEAGTAAVRTLPPVAISATSATLAGEIDAPGVKLTHWFEYRVKGAADPHFFKTCPVMTENHGTKPTSYERAVAGLTPGLTYEFRASARDATGQVDGLLRTFVATDGQQPPETTAPDPSDQPAPLTDPPPAAGLPPAAAAVAAVPPAVGGIPPAAGSPAPPVRPASATIRRVRLGTFLTRKRLVLDVTGFDSGIVAGRATFTYTQRRRGRKPRLRTVLVASGRRRLTAKGGTLTLAATLRGRTLLREYKSAKLVLTVSGRKAGKATSARAVTTLKR